MGKIQKRQRLKKDGEYQRRDFMQVDLTGDTEEVARRRADVNLRNILNFMPGEISVRIFMYSNPQQKNQEIQIMEKIREFVLNGYKEHISRADSEFKTGCENDKEIVFFELVLSPKYKKSNSE